MRKILFGTIVFFSLAFLAACGGGGSGSSGAAGAAGAAGATGADGATGATGSIAIPSGGSLAIAAVTGSLDTGEKLGTVVRTYTISGADALAVDSRQRYYVYEGTSATVKANHWNRNLTFTNVTNANTKHQPGSAVNTALLDSRGIVAGDNFTVLTAQALNTATGAITHMIVCPGNEAGDAAIADCASVALGDRGFGIETADSTLVAGGIDNVSRVFINPDSTQAFALVYADGIASGATAGDDNATSTRPITVTMTNTGVATFGTAQTVVTDAIPPAGGTSGFSTMMDTVQHGDTLYVISAKDNGTLTACGSSGCATSATTVFVAGRGNSATAPAVNFVVGNQIILDSDGTNMIGIADNATKIAAYNLTIPGTPAKIGSDITTVSSTDQWCGAVGGGRALVANDNASGVWTTGVTTEDIDDNTTITFNSTGVDNTTGWDLTSTITHNIDNTTVGVNCSMTYAGMVGTTRTFYMVIDNNTATALYSITDNTTTSGTSIGSPTMKVTWIGTVAATTAESLAIDADSNGVPFFAIDNGTYGATLYRGAVAAPVRLGLAQSGGQSNVRGSTLVFGGVGASTIDVQVSSDDKKVGVAGFSTTGTTFYPAVRIWYED